MALASEQIEAALFPRDWPELICPEAQIFDAYTTWTKVADALRAGQAEASDPLALRALITQNLAEARDKGRAQLEAAFTAQPRASRPLVHSYAYLTDGLVTTALRAVTEFICPAPNDGSARQPFTMLAVGGYGRAEMAPQSDVDLLFLAGKAMDARTEAVIENLLYVLWDLRLKVGHSSRTIKECVKLGREDHTIRTAMLELRPIAGDRPLAQSLIEALRKDNEKSSPKEFVEAKLTERSERHQRQGGQRYMLEPNIKEGKGGLRDLHSLFWIAKFIHRVEHVDDLVGLGVFTPEEYWSFERAEDFLWSIRAHLHLVSGREMDQLTFDMQVEVASRLGYHDHSGRRAVEHFMQDYFRHATRVGELTRIFLTSLEASHAKSEPLLAGLFRRKSRVKPPYQVRQGRLDIEDTALFLSDKLNLLRIFDMALKTGLLLHPDAMRTISANLSRIDKDMRKDKEAARIFMNLLLKHGNPERALRRMNELGALSAFIPEFEPIVAMMQFNVYHSYTVDEHTIQTIKTLSQIEHGELIEELPLSSSILKDGINRKVIYAALLLHDIGKGRDEDHSILGARIARVVAPRLGLKEAECETVEWLVRYHLLMSDMAQKRDLSDPRTVRDFAKAVKTRKRLDLLTVLTVCDIRGVGPDTWNNWKAMLIRSLYRQTAVALENGLEDVNREQRLTEARRSLRIKLKADGWSGSEIKREMDRHYAPYWQGVPSDTQVVFANLLRGLDDDEIGIDLTPDTDRDATRACFALIDHPGIFARVTGALALVGANVVDARSYTSKDGYATSAFWIQDRDGAPYELARLPRLSAMIEKTLGGEVLTREALKSRDKVKKRESGFRFPTSITFDNEGSDIYTLIEVDTRDRPGLLHDLTRSLAEQNLYIASAVVATYGAQAVDTFYVKDMFGLRIHSRAKQTAIERKLREAIEAGAERARG